MTRGGRVEYNLLAMRDVNLTGCGRVKTADRGVTINLTSRLGGNNKEIDINKIIRDVEASLPPRLEC